MNSTILLLCLAVGPGVAAPSTSGLVVLKKRPAESDFLCGNYSEQEWWVHAKSRGGVEFRPTPTHHANNSLPFKVNYAPDRAGFRSVMTVKNGYLVGFDAGEFGGSLWWFSKTGQQSQRLSASTMAGPGGPFQAENVIGIDTLRGEIFVFMGLDHLGGRSGRVFRAVERAGTWRLELVGLLDSAPRAWSENGDGIVAVTSGGLWRISHGSPQSASTLSILAWSVPIPWLFLATSRSSLVCTGLFFKFNLPEQNG